MQSDFDKWNLPENEKKALHNKQKKKKTKHINNN